MSAKAFGIAIKLSVLSKKNQFVYFQTWFFVFIVVGFVVIQLNYLNKVTFLPQFYIFFAPNSLSDTKLKKKLSDYP